MFLETLGLWLIVMENYLLLDHIMRHPQFQVIGEILESLLLFMVEKHCRMIKQAEHQMNFSWK